MEGYVDGEKGKNGRKEGKAREIGTEGGRGKGK